MILPDVNVLVHAYNSSAMQHGLAREWWEAALSEGQPIGLTWAVATGFLRVMTQRRIVAKPMTPGSATAAVRAWLACPRVTILNPGPRHADILLRLVDEVGTAGNLTTDAHLAAIAIEHRAEIATTDTDFARFPGLRWFNPLARRHRRA